MKSNNNCPEFKRLKKVWEDSLEDSKSSRFANKPAIPRKAAENTRDKDRLTAETKRALEEHAQSCEMCKKATM